MAKRWTPGPLSRLFFGAGWSMEVSPEGLRIDGQLHSWGDLTACEVHPAFFWAHLRLGPQAEDLVLRGMPRRLAKEISAFARAIGSLMPAVRAIRTAMAGSRYVSNKIIREALATCKTSSFGWDIDQAKLIAPDLEPLRPPLAAPTTSGSTNPSCTGGKTAPITAGAALAIRVMSGTSRSLRRTTCIPP